MKTIRTIAFEPRSQVPLNAACLVANRFRETLAHLLDAPVHVRLLEPRRPNPSGWRAIASGARIYRLRGKSAEVALLVRSADALLLASAAFGETGGGARELSHVESMALERIVAAVQADLAPICGEAVEPARAVSAIVGFSSYFEIVLEQPVHARFGVAIARDPQPQPVGTLRIGDLDEVRLEVCVRAGGARVAAKDLAGLLIGSVVPITHGKRLAGAAYLAGSLLRHGECGVQGGRYALSIAPDSAAEGATN